MEKGGEEEVREDMKWGESDIEKIFPTKDYKEALQW